MKKILTVGDARRQKFISDMIKFPEPKPTQIPTHPSIGMLVRNGDCVYYAFIRGQCIEGSIEQLESALNEVNHD